MEKIVNRKVKGFTTSKFSVIEDNPVLESETDKRFSESYSKSNPKMVLGENSFRKDPVFWVLVGLSQVFGVACIICAICWGVKYGGFEIADANKLFNYHPLFMIIGLIYCYGDAIIIYRVLNFLPKPILKLIHAILHFSAIVFFTLSLVAVFENHRLTNRADFYSLHSWMGLATCGAFALQFVLSFVTFLYPGLSNNLRGLIMPFHRFLGIGIFVMAVGTAGMGMTEKLIWTSGYSNGEFPAEGTLGNILGFLILIFAFLIVYIGTHAPYQRKPLPSEILPSIQNQ